MTKAEREMLGSITAEYWEYYGIVIRLVGELPIDHSGSTPVWLLKAIAELVGNSPRARMVEDRLHDDTLTADEFIARVDEDAKQSQAHPHEIVVTASPNTLTVEDDYVDPVIDKTWQTLQYALSSSVPGRSVTTKNREGGSGIWGIKQDLKQRDGQLSYEKRDGRIVAIVRWGKID